MEEHIKHLLSDLIDISCNLKNKIHCSLDKTLIYPALDLLTVNYTKEITRRILSFQNIKKV